MACQLSTFYRGEVVSLRGGGQISKYPPRPLDASAADAFSYIVLSILLFYFKTFSALVKLSAGGCQITSFHLCIEVCFVVVLTVGLVVLRKTSKPWFEREILGKVRSMNVQSNLSYVNTDLSLAVVYPAEPLVTKTVLE